MTLVANLLTIGLFVAVLYGAFRLIKAFFATIGWLISRQIRTIVREELESSRVR